MRLFLALSLPQEPSDGLVAALDRADYPRVRIVGRNLWHLTLAFLGDVPETDVDLIKNACAKFKTCPGTITIDSLETFPVGGPRILVGLGKEVPRDAWKTFIEDLRGEMLPFAPQIDRKPWRPHVTVGKGSKDVPLERWKLPVGPWTWKPEGFSLVKSTLNEEGSNYTKLHEFRFTV